MGQRAAWDNSSWEELIDRVQYLLSRPESESDVRSEFSPKAVLAALGASLVSRHKYGLLADAFPEHVNAVESLQLRLQAYREGIPEADIEPGNVEYLIDAMNFAMFEFMHPAHPNAHYKATDKYGSPGRITKAEVLGDDPNQFSNADVAAANS